MKIVDLRNNEDAVAEKERFKEAEDLVMIAFLYSGRSDIPGEFIKNHGSRFKRLKELKGYHFLPIRK